MLAPTRGVFISNANRGRGSVPVRVLGDTVVLPSKFVS